MLKKIALISLFLVGCAFETPTEFSEKALNDVSPEILQWGTCILFAINKSFVTLTDFISFEPDVPKLSLLKIDR